MNTDFTSGSDLPRTLPARLVEKMESLGVSPKKAIEYLALFLLLGAIYYCCLTRDAQQNSCSPEVEITFSQLGVLMLKFLTFTAWPFALVAAWDPAWRSKDAGNVFLAAYAGANALWFQKTGCGFCIFAAAFRIIPFVFCALIAHNLGTWRHRSRREE